MTNERQPEWWVVLGGTKGWVSFDSHALDGLGEPMDGARLNRDVPALPASSRVWLWRAYRALTHQYDGTSH